MPRRKADALEFYLHDMVCLKDGIYCGTVRGFAASRCRKIAPDKEGCLSLFEFMRNMGHGSGLKLGVRWMVLCFPKKGNARYYYAEDLRQLEGTPLHRSRRARLIAKAKDRV